MKTRLLILFLTATLLTSYTYHPEKEFDITGTWEANTGSKELVIIFDKEGYATVKKGNETIGGREFTMNGEKGSMTYKVDFSKSPVHIDFIITQQATGAKKVMMGILQVISDDEIMMVTDADARPTDFDSGDVRLFTRKK